ncbi:MAG: NTP transferase domain-containing protein [Defluviitaleaceae bacterium]|nr:NTP transferase domain-containing protein [Defluviitaleaceae bacterium]
MNATLVVLAAGLGSRFGGPKQITPIGRHGEIIADFSAYDAIRAGFNRIVFVAKPAILQDLKDITAKIKDVPVEIALQTIDDLPSGFAVPADRERPWGTSHALWAARHTVKEPFMVISADDFYGRGVFSSMFQFLTTDKGGEYSFAMPGHKLYQTVSEHGSVSRAVCTTENGYLTKIQEMLKIEVRPEGIGNVCNDAFQILERDTIVNMLAFAFTPAIFDEIGKGFASFLQTNLDHPKAEYFLNSTVGKLINAGTATMKVLPVDDKWMGVTYQEDLAVAQKAIEEMIASGHYPEKLF